MLVLRSKQYEIEEKIQLLSETEELLYEFDMKLTSEDLKRLQKALIGKDTLKLASKIKTLEKLDLNDEQVDNVFDLTEQMESEAIELIGSLCFRQHKDIFIEKGSISKYDEMVAIISDFLLMHFMKKQIERQNTMTSDLAKIGKN